MIAVDEAQKMLLDCDNAYTLTVRQRNVMGALLAHIEAQDRAIEAVRDCSVWRIGGKDYKNAECVERALNFAQPNDGRAETQ